MISMVPKFVGWIVKQLFDGEPRKYVVLKDNTGLHYYNDNQERIACLQDEIIF